MSVDFRQIIYRFLILVCACLQIYSTSVSAALVDRGEVIFYKHFAVINVAFSSPISIESHSPLFKGKKLQVQVKTRQKAKSKRKQELKLASLKVPNNPLYEFIRFDSSDGASGTLTVKFKDKAEYNVQRSYNGSTVMITVLLKDDTMQSAIMKHTKSDDAVLSLAVKTTAFKDTTSGAAAVGADAAANAGTATTRALAATSGAAAVGTGAAANAGTAATRALAATSGAAAVGAGAAANAGTTTTRALAATASQRGSSTAKDSSAKRGTVRPRRNTQQGSRKKASTAAAAGNINNKDPSELMELARQAVANKDYSRAILLYSEVLQMPDNEHSKNALEFLGVARERKGQTAHAKKAYEDYLARYTDKEEDTIRVQQRLTALLTQTETPSRALTRRETEDGGTQWTVFGGVSQFYRYNDLTIDDNVIAGTSAETIKIQSALTNDFYVAAKLTNDNWDIRARASGGYAKDFLDEGPGDETRISNLYVDVRNQQTGYSLKAGRQSQSTGGVLGRFDGGVVSLPYNDFLTFNIVGGLPVNTSTDIDLDTERYFYGANVDIAVSETPWEYNVFLIEQKNNGILDRRSLGGEARYFDTGRSLYALVDYDILFNELNTFLLVGNWVTESSITYSLTVDYRNSPILTTTNALQGQGTEVLTELLRTFTEEELLALAQDRTARSQMVNFGISKPLTENLQINTNLTMTNLSGLPATEGLEAIDGTGNEYSADVQLISSNLFFTDDTNIMTARYFAGDVSNRSTLAYDGRYPLNDKLRLNPRFQVSLRERTDSNTEQLIYRPSFRLNYRWTRRSRIELELGKEWSTRELDQEFEENLQGVFGNLGYRIDF